MIKIHAHLVGEEICLKQDKERQCPSPMRWLVLWHVESNCNASKCSASRQQVQEYRERSEARDCQQPRLLLGKLLPSSQTLFYPCCRGAVKNATILPRSREQKMRPLSDFNYHTTAMQKKPFLRLQHPHNANKCSAFFRFVSAPRPCQEARADGTTRIGIELAPVGTGTPANNRPLGRGAAIGIEHGWKRRQKLPEQEAGLLTVSC